jgi:peptidoglycan/LPS O-acetylase OafA/YrhL
MSVISLPNKLSVTAPSKPPQTIHLLQLYRGIAALFVVCYHSILILNEKEGFYGIGKYFSWGFSGVHLFFVLSGFIICFIHFSDINKPSQVFRYVRNRFVRIYPVYWVVLLIFFPSYLASLKSLNWYHIFDNFTLLRVSNHDKIVAVAWTLSHEVIFYFAFMILIINRWLGIAVVLGWAGMVICRSLIGMELMPPYILSSMTGLSYGMFTNFSRLVASPINGLFMLGGFSFFVYRWMVRQEKKELYSGVAFAFGILMFMFCAVMWLNSGRSYADWAAYNAVFGISSFFLLAAVASPQLGVWAAKQRFLLLLGNASYSIYLIHYEFQKNLVEYMALFNNLNLNLIFMILILTSIGGGLCFYKFVEVPMLRFFGRGSAK